MINVDKMELGIKNMTVTLDNFKAEKVPKINEADKLINRY
jgi:hypothetical protein